MTLMPPHHPATDHFSHQHDQLREENSRLLSHMVDVQRNFQELLRHTLRQNQLQMEALSSTATASRTMMTEGSLFPSAAEPSSPSDDELVQWLKNLSLSDVAIKKVFDLINCRHPG
jgi:hypothetical protein